MRRIVLVAATILILAGTVGAVDVAKEQAELFGAETLEEGLPDYADDLLEDYSPVEQADFGEAVGEIFTKAAGQSGQALKAAAAVIFRVLSVTILCQLVLSMETGMEEKAVTAAGAVAVTACCAVDMQTMIGLGRSTMDELSSFSGLLLPVMAAAAASSGAPVSANGIYAVGMLFSDLLIRACRYLIVPCIYGSLAMAMVDSALGEKRMEKLRELLDWAVRNGLKAVMYLYTGFLAVTGILSGSADAAALKAAKLAFSGMIPVVGGIASDAAETVLASAGLLKNAAGTFGMLAILAIFVLPFLRIGVSYLAFKVTAALCGLLESRQGTLLDAITSAMGSLLAMTGSCAIMCLLSCCCFMQMARL